VRVVVRLRPGITDVSLDAVSPAEMAEDRCSAEGKALDMTTFSPSGTDLPQKMEYH
jgi:hypothetical protein